MPVSHLRGVGFAATLVASLLAACGIPPSTYVPPVVDKPRGEEQFQADLEACRDYERATRGDAFLRVTGTANGSSVTGTNLFQTPVVIIDDCMSRSGYILWRGV